MVIGYDLEKKKELTNMEESLRALRAKARKDETELKETFMLQLGKATKKRAYDRSELAAIGRAMYGDTDDLSELYEDPAVLEEEE